MKVSVCCSAFPFPRENLLRGEHSQPESIPILVDWLGDPAGQYSTETHVVADDLEVALRRGEFMRNHRSSVTFHAGMGARSDGLLPYIRVYSMPLPLPHLIPVSLPNEQRRGRRNLNFSTSEDLSEEEEEEYGDTVRVLIIISQLDMSLGVPSHPPEEN